jgi:hypothetical protein
MSIRQVLGVAAALAIAAAIVLIYVLGFYLPSHNVVTTGGGSWIVNGASSSLGISVGCTNCGQKLAPGSELTVDVYVAVASQSCGFFGCSDYAVESFSVNTPYILDQVSPSNLPYSVASGSSNIWALTITVPGSAGHDPLGGIVGVAYE